MGDNTFIESAKDFVEDIFEKISNETGSVIDNLVETFTDTPEECIRGNPEKYDESNSSIAGSVGWAVGFSFIIFFGTALIVVLIRMFCCKDRCCEVRKDASCAKKFFSWFCILLLPMLLGITAGVLVAYWPQDPQVNDCTQTVDLFGLVTNFLVGDVSAPMVFLLSIYNPNRVDIGIRDLSGVISYQNVQFGTFSVPDFTAQSRHIIDVEADVLLTLPPPSIVTQMYQDYLDDTLVVTFRVNVGYKVAGFSGSVTDYTESIRTGFREDSDDKNYALCKCGQ